MSDTKPGNTRLLHLVLSSIVGGVNEQNSIVKNVRTDNWKAELSIIG